MKVKGLQVIKENIEVNIDPRHVINELVRDYFENKKPSSKSYINEKDGFWYEYDSFDYHKREDIYVKSREATKEELEFMKAVSVIRGWIEKHKYKSTYL